MKELRCFFLSFAIGLIMFPLLSGQEPCTAMEQKALQEKRDPLYAWREQQIETFTEEWIAAGQEAARAREIVTIPVVVHIIWNEEAENLSDEQIASQIEALNADFRLLNSDIARLPLSFSGLAADCEIEFCLASLDPQGFPTSGITRTQTNDKCIGQEVTIDNRQAIHYTKLGGSDAWDPTQYLNIWVGNLCGVLGRGSFPAQAGGPEDGVVVDPANFGTLGILPPYHLGRTLTHEVGHYFNLRHIWGDSTDECDDDGVEDTPLQKSFYLGCPPHPQVSCGSEDLLMNYMNYTDDACMYLFTKGQKERMLAALYGPRSSLLNSKGCALDPPGELPIGLKEENVLLVPNPTTGPFVVQVMIQDNALASIEIINSQGQVVRALERYIRESRPIDLSHFPDGIYFVRITIEQQQVVKKLLLTKE
jgi:outer membrane murein-binding lipoprotein Lpp